MGASVRIEDEAFSDDRFERLAREAGLADADHARGKMARIWRQCTLEQRHVLEPPDVEIVLGENAVDALVAARLGDRMPNGSVRIRGTKGRIEWLAKLRQNGKHGWKGGEFGKLGGRPKKPPRGPSDNPHSGVPENPPTAPAPAPAPVLISPTEISPSYSSPRGTRSSSSKPKKAGRRATPDEEAAIAKVLARLSEAARADYRPTTVSHRDLILALLRKGHTDFELRLVVRLCEDQWANDPAMEHNLRPSTVFRASRFEERLEQARAKWLREGHSEPPPAQPALDLGAVMRGAAR